jgi:prolyl-tRNA synthetase
MVRGDYGVSEVKLKRHLDLETLELAEEKDIKKLTDSKVGFMGPVNLPKNILVIADFTCKDRVNFEVGGNRTGVHLYNVNFERDFPMPVFADIREMKEGDGCPNCDGTLRKIKGIEWGHCFKLDQFYSKPHKGQYTDKDGSLKHYWMGSYGIGLGRTMATIVETHHDEKGILWPKSVSPFDVHLIELKGAQGVKNVYEKLIESGLDVLWDDRDLGAGSKFADADLIGIPIRLVVSKETGQKIELKQRDSDKKELLTLSEIVNRLS